MKKQKKSLNEKGTDKPNKTPYYYCLKGLGESISVPETEEMLFKL